MGISRATWYILVLVILLATRDAVASEITFSTSGGDGITIKNGSESFNYNSNIFITGYSVNCSAEKIIIWGHPKTLNKNNPQDSVLILFDVKNKKPIAKTGFSKGIFGAEYQVNSRKAYIDSGLGSLIDINSGSVTSADPDFFYKQIDTFEKCNKDPSWEFNRYPQDQ